MICDQLLNMFKIDLYHDSNQLFKKNLSTERETNGTGGPRSFRTPKKYPDVPQDATKPVDVGEHAPHVAIDLFHELLL